MIAHRGFVKVGCLTITNEAVERLYQIVQERKSKLVDHMYQKGNYEA